MGEPRNVLTSLDTPVLRRMVSLTSLEWPGRSWAGRPRYQTHRTRPGTKWVTWP
jgi:hypothetical protein